MTTQLTPGELLNLCAVDTDFFCHHFFPKAFRGPSPTFDARVWQALENPAYPLVNLKMFRGAAKTTRLRAYTAKRIAFGTSRTILYVGASESHAVRSIQWLRAQIEPRMAGDGTMRQTQFAQFFGLKPGKKWQESEIEIVQSVPKSDGTTEETVFWVIGVGITGNIRGINFDDYRPDLIILDDVITDENAATEVQREKIADLVMGALRNGLAPASESPNAKMVMLQTPLDANDASARAENSAEWHTEAFGCWTEATKDLPVEFQESSWPQYYPTDVLRKQKIAAAADNRASIFAREMEVRLVAAEKLAFRPAWLKRYSEPPSHGTCVLSIDPVAPPSDAQIAKSMTDKDFEAHSIVVRSKGEYFLLDYAQNRGHDPEWTAAKFFEFKMRYKPICAVLSLVSAERYLKWYLEKEMGRRRDYLPLKEAPIGSKSKFARILSALSGVSSQGKLWCGKQHHEFILQFESYGIGYRGKDDLLESVANGVAELTNPFLELAAEKFENESIPTFKRRRLCP